MALTAEQVLKELAQHRATLRGFGVKRLGLFGSVARGEARPDSDLDFVVELERHTYADYSALLFFLEDLFGRRVDLVEAEALKPRLRPYVEAEVLYAAGL